MDAAFLFAAEKIENGKVNSGYGRGKCRQGGRAVKGPPRVCGQSRRYTPATGAKLQPDIGGITGDVSPMLKLPLVRPLCRCAGCAATETETDCRLC